MNDPKVVRRMAGALGRRSSRAAKYIRLRAKGESETLPLFVFGAQRSGTNMVMSVLDHSDSLWTFNEEHRQAFRDYRIVSLPERLRLIERSPAKWAVFKAINDSYKAGLLLEEHPGARAIWIYRGYRDVANSAVARWGRVELDRLERMMTTGQWDRRSDDEMDEESLKILNWFSIEELTLHEAVTLRWYLVNRSFFTQRLDQSRDVHLLNYERSVLDAEGCFRRVFEDFLSTGFIDAFVNGVLDSSVGRARWPSIRRELEDLCEDLLSRLGEHCRSQISL